MGRGKDDVNVDTTFGGITVVFEFKAVMMVNMRRNWFVIGGGK